jgi:hypothetical protein
VIITSRIADWSPAVQTAESLKVLRRNRSCRVPVGATEAKRPRALADPEKAVALAREMGGLALALEQAGAYVAKNGLSFSEYQQRWESRNAEVLAWYDKRLMNYPSSVAVTWQTTIQELSQSERKLLNILACFGPEPIPLSLLEGRIVNDADARDALAGLASWSLARWMADTQAAKFLHQFLVRRGEPSTALISCWIVAICISISDQSSIFSPDPG